MLLHQSDYKFRVFRDNSEQLHNMPLICKQSIQWRRPYADTRFILQIVGAR